MNRKSLALFISVILAAGTLIPVFADEPASQQNVIEGAVLESELNVDAPSDEEDEADTNDSDTSESENDSQNQDFEGFEEIIMPDEVELDEEDFFGEDILLESEKNEAAGKIIESGTLRYGGEWTLDDLGVYRVTGKGKNLYYAGSDRSKVKSVIVEGQFETVIEEWSYDSEVGYSDSGENGGFEYCTNLTSIELPEGLTSIGDFAFRGCSSLTGIVIPEGVTMLGYESTFEGCSSLISVELPESLTYLGEYRTFEGCSSLESIKIPKGVTTIWGRCFWGCSNLSSVELSEGLKYIEEEAFFNCRSLTEIQIPDGIDYIGESAFSGCTGLTTVKIGKGLTTIQEKAFYGCGNLTSINIPDGVMEIKASVFAGCEKVKCTFDGAKPYNLAGITAHGGWWTVYFHGNLPSWYKHKTGRDANGINWVNIDEYQIKAPTLVGATNVSTGVQISWKAPKGAGWYRVFRKLSTATSWTKVGDTTETSYIDTKVVSGKTYVYTVRCLNEDRTGYASPFDKTGKTTTYLSRCVISKIANQRPGGLQITWKKVPGAKGYVIYRKDGDGSYAVITKIKNGSTVSSKDTTAKVNGQKYTYAVRAYSGSYKGVYTGKTYYRLGTHTISSVKNSAAGTITVKWNGNRYATGYQVRCIGTNEDKTMTITSKTTLNTLVDTLKKGQTYNVYVRGYLKVDGAYYYSAWSEPKTIKITR